ncbi:MAG: SIS domain-containing protein [Patescibacteria group bacterium]
MSDLTTILDSREGIAKLDSSNMLGSIEALHKQLTHAWEDTQSLQFTPTADIHNVLIAGMGGSALGSDVIKHLYKDTLKVPFDTIRDYTLPAYVNENTLVVLASYSGTTEEVVSCAKAAKAKNAQIMVIAAGGTLIDLAKQNDWTAYQIDAKYNPSQQPRMAIGYAVFGTICLLSKAGILSLTKAEVDEVATVIEKKVNDSTVEIPQDTNPAKILAYSMFDKRPIFVVSDFLEGAGHVVTNQSNENAKTFADYKVVPEMNHHLLEGLQFPKSNSDTHIFIFINSQLYHERNQKRMKLTQRVVEDNHIETMALDLHAETKLAQVFEAIALVGFAGYYLSMLEGIDPSPIPFVESFKKQLDA